MTGRSAPAAATVSIENDLQHVPSTQTRKHVVAPRVTALIRLHLQLFIVGEISRPRAQRLGDCVECKNNKFIAWFRARISLGWLFKEHERASFLLDIARDTPELTYDVRHAIIGNTNHYRQSNRSVAHWCRQL